MANMVNASYLHSGFSVPGLDRTKSYRFQSFFIVAMVISILLKTAF